MFENDVQIYLLGSFVLLIGKCLIAESVWTRRKAKRLVQILAVYPHHKIHCEELAELLFKDKNAAQAHANLSRVLYLARHALEPALAHALALSSEAAKAEYILRQMLDKRSGEYVSLCHIAIVLLGLNRKDEALACLENSCSGTFGDTGFFIV